MITSLVAQAGGPARVEIPELARIVSPASLASSLMRDDAGWSVVCPDDAALAAARLELGLQSDAPVPIQVGVSHRGMTLLAVKQVVAGEARENPSIDSATAGGRLLRELDEVVVEAAEETPLRIEAVLEDDVNWLTSVGTMNDYDLPSSAYLTVDADDALEGQLAVVFRDSRGGVTWRVWPLRAEGRPRPAD